MSLSEVPKEVAGHALLDGKVVVVTAAAGTGIGSATARRALAEGADVVISDHHERRLGETADELSALGQQIVYARELSNLAELAQRNGAADDPFIRERLTRAWTGLRAMRSYALATMDVEQPGQDNVSKLLWANWHRDLGELAMDVIGKTGMTMTDGEFDEWQRLFLFTRADTIYGGSNEIQRNIIAERALGLPRQARP